MVKLTYSLQQSF